MARSRREFLAKSSLGLMGVAMSAKSAGAKQTPETPGAPPAFGTAAPVGPAVTTQTFVEAEKLLQVEMTPKDLAQAAGNWQQSLAAVYAERRVGPRRNCASMRRLRRRRCGILRCRERPAALRGMRLRFGRLRRQGFPQTKWILRSAPYLFTIRVDSSRPADYFGAADEYLSQAAGNVRSGSCTA